MDPLNDRERRRIRHELSVGAETFAVLILAAIIIAGAVLKLPECQDDRDRCGIFTALARPAVAPADASSNVALRHASLKVGGAANPDGL
jgi:hypothetical protein